MDESDDHRRRLVFWGVLILIVVAALVFRFRVAMIGGKYLIFLGLLLAVIATLSRRRPGA